MNALTDAIEGLRGLYRKHNPDTSKAAAAAIVGARPGIQQEVLDYAWYRGAQGFTDTELLEFMSSTSSSYRTRRAELTAKGLIVPSRRRERLPSGRHAVVWVHKDFYKEENE